MPINRNRMAKWVAEQEGLKVQMNIAQIKECQKWILIYLAKECRPSEVVDLIEKIKDE